MNGQTVVSCKEDAKATKTKKRVILFEFMSPRGKINISEKKLLK